MCFYLVSFVFGLVWFGLVCMWFYNVLVLLLFVFFFSFLDGTLGLLGRLGVGEKIWKDLGIEDYDQNM